MGIGVIITMASLTFVSGVSSGVLTAMGKTTESQYLNVATVCGLITTVATIFATAMTKLGTLGR